MSTNTKNTNDSWLLEKKRELNSTTPTSSSYARTSASILNRCYYDTDIKDAAIWLEEDKGETNGLYYKSIVTRMGATLD